MRVLVVAFIGTILGTLNCIAQPDRMKAYPAAEKGMVRYVWNPPANAKENDLKVEIVVGKNVEVDQVNRHFLAGTLTEETIEGWGYPKYVVKSNGRIGGTLIGVPVGEPKVTKFVALRSGPNLFRYSSKLPLVVYAPEGFIVKFRVWRPDSQVIEGQPG